MYYWINVRDTFDAAHFLPGHKGKCSSLHGHTYTVEVGVKHAAEAIIPTQGFAVDMGDMKAALRKVLEQFDHKCLNTEGFTIPSAEFLAQNIHAHIDIPGARSLETRVRVWETPDSYVEVSNE